MANKFTVGLIQMRFDDERGRKSSARDLRDSRSRGAWSSQIICMDELFRGEYFCRK